MKITKLFVLLMMLFLLSACSPRNHKPYLTYLLPKATVLAFGDSLTYGTGASTPEKAYPAVLEKLIGRRVINAGNPGMQTDEALRLLPELLKKYQPNLVILCIGGNDLLAGKNMKHISANIEQMVFKIRAHSTEVVLIGVPKPTLFLSPPEFYEKIADSYKIPLENDLLSQLERDNALKSDNIHLNDAGYQKMAERIAELLKQSGAVVSN